jgi:hypothetical protein
MRPHRVSWALALTAILGTVGCEAPRLNLPPNASGSGKVSFFDSESTRASVSIRLIDKRQTTQALSDADAYNGVLFEIRNDSRFKSSQRVAKASSLGSYEVVFDDLPSDSTARYTVTAGFFRGVSAPTSLSDPAYANLDRKVAEGTSDGFSLAPGEQKTLTIVINAVGTLSFTSTSTTVDPAAPSFTPGDTTAAGLLALSPAKNPLATGVTYAVKQTNGTTVSTGSVPVAQWATWPTQTRLPFTAPTTEATYSFVVDMVNGVTVLSRRSRDFVVKAPTVTTLTITGTYSSMKVNGQAWSNGFYTTYTAPATGTSVPIMFVNSSSEWLYASYSGGSLFLNPSQSASRSVPVSNGQISIYMDVGP